MRMSRREATSLPESSNPSMHRLLASLLLLAALPATASAQNCGPGETDLIAGQTITMGRVKVWNSATDLHIRVNAWGAWRIEEVQIYAGPGPLPTNAGGNVAPGQFPFKTSYNPPARFHEETIPFSLIQQQCGDTTLIAVHCSVVKYDANGNIIQQETAWGFGNPFTGNQWGWSFDKDLCCTGCDTSGQLGLTVDPLHQGQSADLTAVGANPGALVRFFSNCGPIDCGNGASCSNSGYTIDLVGPIHNKASVFADPNGVAVLTITVPNASTIGRVYGFQAATQITVNGQLTLLKSAPVLAPVIP